MDEQIEKGPEKKLLFQPYTETYPYSTFALAIGLMYPNKSLTRFKIIAILLIFGFHSGELIWFIIYVAKCLYREDLYNFSRCFAIAILVFMFFFKYFNCILTADTFSAVLKKISSDLLKANDLEEDYQSIYLYYIEVGRFGEKFWTVVPNVLSLEFPLLSVISMLYSYTTDEGFKRVMVHEQELYGIEDVQYESPYFELVFAYMCCQAIALAPNFWGYDSSFCISTCHIRMKISLMLHKLERAFEEYTNEEQLLSKMKEVIKEHQEILGFFNLVQATYGNWLLAVFMLSSLIISMNLYIVFVSGNYDPKSIIYAVAGTCHIYIPCYYASEVSKMSQNLPNYLYAMPWEKVNSTKVTKMLMIMIRMSQNTFWISGNGIVVFTMTTFVSIVKTSYSFYCLLARSKQ